MTLARWSLALGLVTAVVFVFTGMGCLLVAIPALVCGIRARRRLATDEQGRAANPQRERELATAGLVLAGVPTALIVVSTLLIAAAVGLTGGFPGPIGMLFVLSTGVG